MNINDSIGAAFQINAQAKVLQDTFADILNRLQSLETPSTAEVKPKGKGHKDYRIHRTKTCGKYGRMAADATCICEAIVPKKD